MRKTEATNSLAAINHLDIWTGAWQKKAGTGRGKNGKLTPYGIQKLRELILELAVRGRLVPQDPNDEPASVLLEKIAEEKARLVKEGILKKQKPLPSVTDDEELFKLPEGWAWVRLGYIGEVFNGNSISKSLKEAKYNNIDGDFPFLATKDIGYGWQELTYDTGVSIPKDEPKFKVAHQGAVLICAEGGSAGKKCGITKRDICFGNKLFAIELYGNIEPNYLLANYLTPSFFEQVREKMTGIIGGISLAKFKQLIIPMPPLAEQHRIVAKVDELMALCDRLEQEQTDSLEAHQTLVETLLRTLVEAPDAKAAQQAWTRIAQHFDTLFTTEHSIDQLKQTILQLAVMGKLIPQDPNDEPVEVLLERLAEERQEPMGAVSITEVNGSEALGFDIPGSWQWQTLGNLLTYGPANGFSPKGVDFETPVRSLTLSATTSGYFRREHFKYIATEIPPDSDLWLQDGDILVQRGNTIEYVGVSAVYHGEPNQFIYPDLMMKIRVASTLDVDFIHLAMSHKHAREYLRARATGTSGTMPKINQTTLKMLPIPIPPYAEQKRIVAKINEITVLCDTLKARIRGAEATCARFADAVVARAVAG